MISDGLYSKAAASAGILGILARWYGTPEEGAPAALEEVR